MLMEKYTLEIVAFGVIWMTVRAVLIIKLKVNHFILYETIESPKIFGSMFTRSWWLLDKFVFLRQDKVLNDGLLSFIVLIFIPIAVSGYLLWVALLMVTFYKILLSISV